ncbi:MraY family glycosyltransferase [Solirhodobacter olei]|uniref:MraY family glycosyltransferase n=1 Tax=Solirhodobacter olei TaxID=2493082 RepID=UPI0013E3CE92|nr:glycosyltransferase [Solirhodobacter olei]
MPTRVGIIHEDRLAGMWLTPEVISFSGSLLACWLLVRTGQLHGHLTHDLTDGAQKIHEGAVPRIGGIGLASGLILGGATLGHGAALWWIFALGALPAFAAGLWEDLTKTVPVRVRLTATIAAGVLFAEVTGYSLHHLDLWPIDSIIGLPVVAIGFTGLAIGGVANAMNIIDGCNGLAGGTGLILLAAMGCISAVEHDYALVSLILLTMAGVMGFLLINFPHGRIFLGDAGAYALGFLVAAFAIALPARHADVSPAIGLLVVIYPVSETLYSVVRRLSKARTAVSQPDRLHLHSLTFEALKGRIDNPVFRNSLSSVFIWALPLLSALMSFALAWSSVTVVLLAAAANVLLYRLAYAQVLRLTHHPRAPRGKAFNAALMPAPMPSLEIVAAEDSYSGRRTNAKRDRHPSRPNVRYVPLALSKASLWLGQLR